MLLFVFRCSPKPHEVIGDAFSRMARSRVCDSEIDSWCNARIKGTKPEGV